MLIYIFLEYGYIFIDIFIVNNQVYDINSFVFIPDLINISVVFQIVLLSWLLIQRFNRITNTLEDYQPDVEIKNFLQNPKVKIKKR